MRIVFSKLKRLTSALLIGIACMTPAAALDVRVSPAATYLHTHQDNALSSPAIDLTTAGLAGGDCAHLERMGDFDNGPGGDTFTSLLAVFSRTTILLAAAQSHRVPDAVDAGTDFASAPTYYGSQPTDIPEDFAISFGTMNGVDLLIPTGAAYLFYAPHDSWYQDNFDPDVDYYVRILPLAPFEVSPAGSPAPLMFVNEETLQWEDVALNCADTYNVYRGDVADLPLRQYGSCLQSGITGNTTTDPDAPLDGRGWFYLVTAKNDVGESPLGFESSDQPRVSGSPCP